MLSITLYVDDDATGGNGQSWATAYNDLQTALTYASNPANDVEAIWIAEGTYTPTAELQPGDPRSAGFSLLDNIPLYGGFAGTETTLAERDLTAGHTTILSGDLGIISDTSDNAYTIVYCDDAIETSLDGLTITAGNANGSYDAGHLEKRYGAGIFSLGNLTITNVTLSDNYAIDNGGGIYSSGDTSAGSVDEISILTVTNGTFSNNSAGDFGGGIYYEAFSETSALTIANSTFTNNSAYYGGGGICSKADNEIATFTITDSTFSDNSAMAGGGIRNTDAVLTITDSTISTNTANSGGGIYNQGSNTETTMLTLTNCTISGNSSDKGAGIMNNGYAHVATLIVTNSTLSNNSADDYGAGFYNNGTLSVATLNNTIVAGNIAPSYPDIYNPDGALSGSSNLIGDGTGQSELVDGVVGNLVGTTASPLDPMLGPLQDNGGPTLTHDPLPGSPAIDAGDNVLAVESPESIVPLMVDQRGYLRCYAAVDLGAVEYQPFGVPIAYGDILTTNQNSALTFSETDLLQNDISTDGNVLTVQITTDPAHGDLTVHGDGTFTYTPDAGYWGTDSFTYQAVNDAGGPVMSNLATVFLSVVSPQSVMVTTVDDEQDGNLSPDDLSLREALYDLGASQIQFSMDLVNQEILLGATLDIADVVLCGLGPYLTVNGNDLHQIFAVAPGDTTISQLTITNGSSSSGGGIYNAGNLTVMETTFFRNASDGVWYGGGAIDNRGSLTVIDSTFLHNQAQGDGPGGGIFNDGDLTVIGTTFAHNSAGEQGGGIFNAQELTVIETTFSNNAAGEQGGGIFNIGNLTIIETVFSNNLAGDVGGGIFNDHGILTVRSSTFEGNAAEGSGGAIGNQSSYTEEATATVTSCTFFDNLAMSHGGAIYNAGLSEAATLTVTNSTLSGNSAISRGGAIYTVSFSETATLSVTNSTLFGNAAEFSGGGIQDEGGNAVVTLQNTIIAGNVAPSGSDLGHGSGTLTGFHNLIGDGTGQSDLVNGTDGNLVGTTASPIDPVFVDEAGGDYRLATGSPIIDAGDNTLIPDGIIIDLDNHYRTANSTVDIGAYEYGSVPLLDGDANGDGKVDSSDLGLLANKWQKGVPDGDPANITWIMGDFNGDGKVDSSDLGILSNNWQKVVSFSALTIFKTIALKAEPEETTTQEKYTPPASALLAVATVPLQETLPPRHWITPAATDAILAGSLEPIEDFTAIARDIAASSAKDVHNTEPELGTLELDLYDNFE